VLINCSIMIFVFSAIFILIRMMLASMGISCCRVSVCLSVTSRCSTETAKCRLTQTTPHDSQGTLVFWCLKSRQNSDGVTPNGGDKCRWGRLNAGAVAENWWLSRLDAKYCQISSVASLSHWASTLFLCSMFAVMQHVAQVWQQQVILDFLFWLGWVCRKPNFADNLEQVFYRLDVLDVGHPTVPKHWRELDALTQSGTLTDWTSQFLIDWLWTAKGRRLSDASACVHCLMTSLLAADSITVLHESASRQQCLYNVYQ